MAEQSIFSREAMQARGARAFAAGKRREQHDMNPGALALPDWLAGYDQASHVAKRQLASSPQLHGNRAGGLMFDGRQGDEVRV